MLSHHAHSKATQSYYFRHTFFVQSPHTPSYLLLCPPSCESNATSKKNENWIECPTTSSHPEDDIHPQHPNTLPIITLQNLHLSTPLGLCLCQAWQRTTTLSRMTSQIPFLRFLNISWSFPTSNGHNLRRGRYWLTAQGMDLQHQILSFLASYCTCDKSKSFVQQITCYFP